MLFEREPFWNPQQVQLPSTSSHLIIGVIAGFLAQILNQSGGVKKPGM